LLIIRDTGFKIVNNFKLLGANITANSEDLSENFEPVIQKIVSLIAYWSRFRLSLPGRITIAKTFLISQINYLGSVFLPREDQLQRMQTAINSFIRKNLRISDDRIYLPVENGGLGFFNIKHFLHAQMSTWVLKAKKWPIDNWRYDLHLLAPENNPLLLRCCDVPKQEYPVLHDIVAAYEQFYGNFSRAGNNYIDAQIFGNELFTDHEAGSCIKKHFLVLIFTICTGIFCEI
jgi:hypothetical protein